MSNPDATQVFNACDPLVDSGQQIQIDISQTLTRPKNGGGKVDLLNVSGSASVHLRVEGPQTTLLDSDIVGVFPSPGSDTSPDEFLPHIALKRRTLPWERVGPKPGSPWLALLLLKQSEIGRRFARGGDAQPITPTTVAGVKTTHPKAYARFKAAGLTDSTAIDVVFAPTTTLQKVLSLDDVPLLCHVRRAAQDNPLAKLDDDRDLAVVVSGRLPDASGDKPEPHYAYLVSLEQRTDLQNPSGATTPLIVLHYWSFTPSTGGDFEEVIKAIRVRPHGGVLRFGNLPKGHAAGEPELSGGFAAMLDDAGYLLPPAQLQQDGTQVEYRGPLRPFAPPLRSRGFAVRPAPEEFDGAQHGDPPDYSHAAAFEIGRLSTLAGEGLAEDLHQIKFGPILPEIEVPVAIDKLPDALRRPDWVVDPEWWDDPYTLPGNQQMLKNELQLLQPGQADFTGIAAQSAPWKQSVMNQIEQLAGIEQSPIGQIEIGSIGEQVLHEAFAEVVAITKSH
ncbi:MAG: hypothetical protein GC160_01465 [Acidobacteria bacterium]|nr:hypothetical protein [Acidobacteriota bacterium]